MRVGERAAVCCVTYVVYVHVRIMARLVWPMPAVTVTPTTTYTVPLMSPMPAAIVTSSLPRLHASAPDVADACRNRHFITIT